ncbi:MAG: kelch repeat-containing protein [Chloroflexales bacterium]
MPHHSHGRLLMLLVVSILALLPSAPLSTSAAPTPPVLSTSIMPAAPPPHANTTPPPATVTGIPPLPRSCIRGGTPLDSFAEAICCVSGFVYLNGVPVAGANVTINVAGRTLTTTTKSGPDSGQSYYAASLNAAPLSAKPGNTVIITATASGQTNSVTFTAQEGGRQEDVVLAQSSVEAAWTQGEIPARSDPALAYDATRQRVVLFGGYVINGSYLNDTWEWNGTTWTQRMPANSPPARYGNTLAYDATRQRVVLFGGLGSSGYLNDTWEWDGTTWTQRMPANSPPDRYYHALAYDTTRQRVTLFGGQNSSGFLNDTWEWDGTTWTLRTPASSPSARYGHALAYDAIRQHVILFGGYNGNSLNDTWEWDGMTWTLRTPTLSPPARYSHALFYDATRQRVVLFGGFGSSGILNDTWEWDGTMWTLRTLASSPPARYSHAMAYDATRQRVVLFGGYGSNGSFLNDTWEYDGTTWNRQLPSASPPARTSHNALAYDATRQRVILFGGQDSSGFLNDTWEWDGTTWMQRTPASSPPARSSHAMAYDATRQRVILFGGFGSSGILNDTWEWDGTTWNQIAPSTSPPARSSHAMTYDAARQRVVLFGGDGVTTLNDTWEWDGTTWTQRTHASTPTAPATNTAISTPLVSLTAPATNTAISTPLVSSTAPATNTATSNPTATSTAMDTATSTPTATSTATATNTATSTSSPPARSSHAMAYDTARQRVILFGGSRRGIGGGFLNDIWEWDGTTWTQITSATSPPARSSHAMAYDATRQRVVLFGGSGSNGGGFLNDIWEWDGTTWTQITPATSPPAQSSYVMAYDTARQRVVIFSGNDTWTYDGTRCRLAISDYFTQPGTHTSPALAYESNGDTLLFGGRNGTTPTNDTFRWNGSGWKQVTPLNLPPSARSGSRLARNSDGSRLLLFGGMDGTSAYLNDTWIWDSANDDWLIQAPATKPSARALSGLTYDRNRSVWVLFGGQSSGGYLGDTWEYNGTDWTQRTPATSPPTRSNATLTYDPVRGRAVLVGGQGDTGLFDDVWEWDGTNWANVTPAQRLSARTGHGAAYDSTRSVIVVSGGSGSSGVISDTLEWNGSFWRQRTTSPDLPAMFNQAMDYDVTHDRMVSFGGENSSGAVAGVYLHQVMGTPSAAPPVATINHILPRDARQGSDTITFEGTGADADSSNVISAYRWSLGGTVISTQASFTKPAADIPLGAQTISFDVQDNEGIWSPAIEQTITIRDGGGGGITANKSWTLMIYAAADNNLAPWMGENSAFNGMLYRLQKAGPLANVQVAILYDGPGADDTYHYTLDASGVWTKTKQPEAQMDAMETLRDFVIWGRGGSGLPATDYYALAIVDHANGIVGIAQDETSKSTGNPRPFLTPLELRVALQAATDDGAHKLDVIHYDGCSFGLFEDAAIAAGLANFVIASPNTGWGIFAYDSYRQLASRAADPRAYAISIAGRYAELVTAEQLPYTISAFDMANFAALNTAISELGQSLLTYVQADLAARRDTIKALRLTMQKYDSGEGTPIEPNDEDNYVDVVDLAQKFKGGIDDPAVQTAADQVIALALPSNQRFVAYESHLTKSFPYVDPARGGERTYNVQLDNAHGLGLYYPPRSSANLKSAYVTYIEHRLFDITRDSGWTKFIGQGLPAQLDITFPSLLNDSLMPLYIPQNSSTPSAAYRVFLPLIER